METLVEQPSSYNPEIRRKNDTITWLAETLEGSMRTPCEFSFNGNDLIAEDGSNLGHVFTRSIEEAKLFPIELSFELRRRLIEEDEYQDMLRMVRNKLPNTMVVVSDFPPELMEAEQSIGDYNIHRKQTMLRVITLTSAGKLHMRSQSLDLSDPVALAQIYKSFGRKPEKGELLGQRIYINLDNFEQEFLVDRLMGIYDRALSSQFGGVWRAGRPIEGTINTFDFVCSQTDLLETYFYYGGNLKENRLTRELAAAMKLRFEGKGNRIPVPDNITDNIITAARTEMFEAGLVADTQGISFFGCGLTSKAPGQSLGESQVTQLGYGNRANKPSSEKLIWKDGICRIDNCPTRPHKTKVAQCSVCRGCQQWFDRGRDPSKIYKGLKRLQEEAVTVKFGWGKLTKIKKANQ